MVQKRKQKRKTRSAIEVLQHKISELRRYLLQQQNLLPTNDVLMAFENKKQELSSWLAKNEKLFNAKVIKLEQVKASKKDKNIFTFFKDRNELNLQIDKLTNSISVYKDKKDELSKNEIQIKNMYSLKEEVLKLNLQINYYKDELAKTKQRKIDIEEQKKQREINRKKTEEILKAKAAQFDKKNRERTDTLKNIVWKRQLEISNQCPYCNLELEIGNTHCDHIIPVNKGGLPRIENLVHVCSRCNLKKKDFTVYHFCNEVNFDFEVIAKRLKKLDKEV